MRAKVPDGKITPLKKKFMRPYFALNPWSWEMNHFQAGHENAVYYLFVININTRYLSPLAAKCKDFITTRRLIQQFIEREHMLGHEVYVIEGDGDKEFQAVAQSFSKVRFHIQDSQFTLHNRTVERVMRTLRNASGPNTNHVWNTRQDQTIQQLVQYYNISYHNGIKIRPP